MVDNDVGDDVGAAVGAAVGTGVGDFVGDGGATIWILLLSASAIYSSLLYTLVHTLYGVLK